MSDIRALMLPPSAELVRSATGCDKTVTAGAWA